MTLNLNINVKDFNVLDLKEKSNFDAIKNRERYTERQRIVETQKKAEKLKAERQKSNIILQDGLIIKKQKNVIDQRKRQFRPDEIAAFLQEIEYDVLVFELFWQDGSDYDLNVGFAETIQYVNGLRPEEGQKLPEFVNYVGWTFDRYELNNFIYHYGDVVQDGPAYEYVVLDLTRERIGMPTWAQNFILLELRSYCYDELSTLPLQLSIYPVIFSVTDLPFDPTDPTGELERLKALSIQQNENQFIVFETDNFTDRQSGDLGELIATVPIDFVNRSWRFNQYQ